VIQLLKPSTARSWRETLGPRIYFAGKITKTDWRGDVMTVSRTGAIEGGHDEYAEYLFDPHYTVAHSGFRYGGPFFVSCDHGCGHGPATHGAAFGGCLIDGASMTPDEVRRSVYKVSLERIILADFIFAHINETDCFGTLYELGYASAASKPIFLNFGSKISAKQRAEFWFVAKSGVTIDGTTREAFQRALRLWRRCQPVAA
jgi:hypothetical protein